MRGALRVVPAMYSNNWGVRRCLRVQRRLIELSWLFVIPVVIRYSWVWGNRVPAQLRVRLVSWGGLGTSVCPLPVASS